jgi:branched-chain amino acid transport system permease protein
MDLALKAFASPVEQRNAKAMAIGFAAMLALFVAGPFFLYPVFLMKVMCFALFGCAFNLAIGHGGLASFGHAAFFGVAAYVCGHAAKAWGLTPELAILAGTAAGALLGFLVAWIATRSQGIYFAMITLAMAQMLYYFCVKSPFTGGDDGLQAIPRGMLFGAVDLRPMSAIYGLVFAVFMGGFLFLYRVVHSPFGEALEAIRDNEARAVSLGYKVNRYKVLAFGLSAALSGLAGALKAVVFQLATLTDVHWSMSGEVLLITLLGGLATTFGPVVGALVLVTLQVYLATLGSWVLVAQGTIFVACVMLFRRGIVGELAHRLRCNL